VLIVLIVVFSFIIDVLRKLIGSGRYGKVYRIYKRNITKPMVMKIINIKKVNKEGESNEEISKSLESELRVGVSIGMGSSFLLEISEYFIENNDSDGILEWRC
jgi:serine/threonine protein kinase